MPAQYSANLNVTLCGDFYGDYSFYGLSFSLQTKRHQITDSHSTHTSNDSHIKHDTCCDCDRVNLYHFVHSISVRLLHASVYVLRVRVCVYTVHVDVVLVERIRSCMSSPYCTTTTQTKRYQKRYSVVLMQ